MLDNLTLDDLANEIRLTRSHPTGRSRVFVLVEGVSDQRLYRKFFCNDTVQIRIPQGGKSGISGIFAKLDPNIDKLIGIRDADFSRLLPEEIAANIFLTDMHDLEMMLIHSDRAFNSVVCEHDPAWSESSVVQLRQKLLYALYPIGRLRFINDKDKKGLKFSAVSLKKHVLCDASQVSIRINDYITDLCKRSSKSQDSENLDVALNPSAQYAHSEICNGHDFFEILAVYFSNRGAVPAIKDKDLESAMRVAYSYEDFQQTELFKQLSNWSQKIGLSLFVVGNG